MYRNELVGRQHTEMRAHASERALHAPRTRGFLASYCVEPVRVYSGPATADGTHDVRPQQCSMCVRSSDQCRAAEAIHKNCSLQCIMPLPSCGVMFTCM